jgi:hypothetical protein
MKDLNDMVAGREDGQSSSDLDETALNHPPEEAFTTKKLALLQKCDDLAEVTEHYAGAYEAVLRALAVSNRQSIKTLQDQLFQLKESIPQLEKKFIKRIKLVGTLTDLHKQTRKIKLKPEMARKKDLNKIDDFLLRSYRTLNALNGKRTQR